MKRQSVMLGNGINRCVLSNISWGDLLSDIAQDHEIDLNPNISFPMQFENIMVNSRLSLNYPEEKHYGLISQKVLNPTDAIVCKECGHIEFIIDWEKCQN